MDRSAARAMMSSLVHKLVAIDPLFIRSSASFVSLAKFTTDSPNHI